MKIDDMIIYLNNLFGVKFEKDYSIRTLPPFIYGKVKHNNRKKVSTFKSISRFNKWSKLNHSQTIDLSTNDKYKSISRKNSRILGIICYSTKNTCEYIQKSFYKYKISINLEENHNKSYKLYITFDDAGKFIMCSKIFNFKDYI